MKEKEKSDLVWANCNYSQRVLFRGGRLAVMLAEMVAAWGQCVWGMAAFGGGASFIPPEMSVWGIPGSISTCDSAASLNRPRNTSLLNGVAGPYTSTVSSVSGTDSRTRERTETQT